MQITKVTNACSFSSGIGIGNSGNNSFQPATEVANAAGRIIALVFTLLPNPRICFVRRKGRGGRERTNHKFHLDTNAMENLLRNKCKTNDRFRQVRFEKTGRTGRWRRTEEEGGVTAAVAVARARRKVYIIFIENCCVQENRCPNFRRRLHWCL
jgi:hypothetical protein